MDRHCSLKTDRHCASGLQEWHCHWEEKPSLDAAFEHGSTYHGCWVVKNLPANNAGDAGDLVSIPGSGRSPGGGNGNPFQYSCLENLMDRGAWWATVHGIAKSQTQLKWLSMHAVLTYPVMVTFSYFFLFYVFTLLVFSQRLRTSHKQWQCGGGAS